MINDNKPMALTGRTTIVTGAAQGFALVVALGIMAFLVLLLITLASLVQLETRRANDELLQLEARQNALLGLKLAIAQIQVQAGPDRIATSRADILERIEEDEELSVIPATGKRFWTAAWQSSDLLQVRAAARAPSEDEDGEPFQPEPVWLVSGQPEMMDFTTEFDSSTPWVELVSGAEASVRVESVPVPGADAGRSTGSYAYWAGDESLKARINLINPFLWHDNDSEGSRYQFLAAQRFGVENIDQLDNLAMYFNPQTAQAEAQVIGRIVSPSQLALLGGEDGTTSTQLKDRIHDLTSFSAGVLSDSARGGLRRDLTRGLSEAAIPDTDRVFADGPRWQLFRNFFDISRTVTGPVPSIRPTVTGANIGGTSLNPFMWRNRVQIAPIVIATGISYGLSVENFLGPTPSESLAFETAYDEFVREMIIEYYAEPRGNFSSDADYNLHITNLTNEHAMKMDEYADIFFDDYYRIYPHIQPYFILANPYNVALNETEYWVRTQTGNWSPASIGNLNAPAGAYNPRVRITRPAYLYQNANTPGPDLLEGVADQWRVNDMIPHSTEGSSYAWLHGQASYRLRFEAGFEPGEIKVFMPNAATGNPLGGIATTHVLELEDVNYEDGINVFASQRWVKGRIEPHLRIQQGIRLRSTGPGNPPERWNNSGTNPALPPLPNKAEPELIDWRIFLDERSSLVHKGLISSPNNLPVNLNSNSSHPPQYRTLMYIKTPEFEATGLDMDEVLTKDANIPHAIESLGIYSAYLVSTGGAGVFSDTQTSSLPGGGMIPLLHTTCVLKATHQNTHNIRPLISANIRSPNSEYTRWDAAPPGATGSDADRIGWGVLRSILYTWETGGGVNPVLDDSRLWEAEDDSQNRIILFHIPREQLFSVGDFQHMDPSSDSIAPTYAVGNSFALPWVPSDRSRIERHKLDYGSATMPWIFDFSYELNEVLWDGYFFSTWMRPDFMTDVPEAPAVDSQSSPANPRFVPLADQAAMSNLDYQQIAGQMLIDGPFNINSTSVDAWKAVLSGLNQQEIQFFDPVIQETTQSEALSNPLFRSPYPSGDSSAFWRGFRELTADEIDLLARNIVNEVKRRGPFASLGHFINRTLAPPSNSDSLMGPLQRAIDQTVINDLSWSPFEVTDNTGSTYFEEAALGRRAAGGPGYITQADILRILGPILTTRSDTFVIRSYGDVSGDWDGGDSSPRAQAWCEAVVQRLPEWVSEENFPHAEAGPIGQRFGRGFRLVSVRWLSGNEL